MNQDCIALLITQVWQVTFLFVVVWIAVRLFAKDRPHLAHALWVLVLIKCITPPVWSSPASPFSWLTSPSTPVVGLADGKTSENKTANRSWDEFSSSANPILVRMDRKFFEQDEMNSRTDLNPASSSETQTTQSAVSPLPWATVVVSLWICGALTGLLITICRFGLFLRWTGSSRSQVEPKLQQLVVRLSRKLGIKRRVNIRVLDCPIGPAVLGLLRPTILLPAAIVNDRPESELEPLIAHELVHIRRGDLWWAVVQTLAGCLFWFHPLIRIAVRMVTRESERSCDEETVASLGCSPAAYVRGLLEILEQKQRLRVAPAVPGVRPVDITFARLERVMKLGNGSLKRTPLWVWLVMFVCGAMVLPGAALVFAQDQVPDNFADQSSTPLHTGGAIADSTSLFQLESLDIGDLLTDLRERLNPEIAGESEKRLLSMLPCRFPGASRESCRPHGSSVEFVAGDNGEFGFVQLGNDHPTMKIRGNMLYVYETLETIEVVKKTLAELRENGFRQIVVEVRFMSGAGEVLENAGVNWQNDDQVAGASHVIESCSLPEFNQMPGVTGETGPEFQRASFPAVSKFGQAGAAAANNVSDPAADETGPLVEASVRLPVGQVPAADETPDANSQGGLMIIRSTLQLETENDFEPVIQSLNGRGLRLQLETDVQLNVVKDGVAIRGEFLEMVADEDESFYISGDLGEIEFGRNDQFSMRFTGNAKMKQHDDFDAQAENLLYAFDGSDESFLLEGDAILITDEFQLRAQKIRFDGERILVEREARLIQNNKDGAAADIRGEQIKWNTDTDMITVDGVENGVLLRKPVDDIQYFPQGPEFRLSREAAALKQARANSDR